MKYLEGSSIKREWINDEFCGSCNEVRKEMDIRILEWNVIL